MLITKEIEIDMGHRVPNHATKCRNLHGHRYKIEVGVDDKIIDNKGLPNEGMVIDFGDLKNTLLSVIDAKYDHNSIFYEKDPIRPFIEQLEPFQNKKPIFVSFIPTAENITKHFFEILEPILKEKGVKLKHVKIWETPSSTAIYQLV